MACTGSDVDGEPTGAGTSPPTTPSTAPPSEPEDVETGDVEPERIEPEEAPYDLAAAVRERVTVFSDRDDDGDGLPDRFVLDIIRPADAVDVPVILEQSPYWDGLGRGLLGERRDRDRDRDAGPVTRIPLWYDNWFVPQGYAFVAMDTAGTGQSSGCFDNLGRSSQAGAVAALDFLSGTAEGRDAAGDPVSATWSSGSVAMVGKSADAHHALLAATTGHEALDAVVSIGTVTSIWQQAAPGGVVNTPWPLEGSGRCSEFNEQWNAGIGDGTAPTEEMLAADVLGNLDDYRAPTLIAQGLRDLNTRSGPTLELWEALGEHGVDRRLWLHQGGHTDPFDLQPAEWVAEVDAWLDHHLRSGPALPDPAVHLQLPDLSWVTVPALPEPVGERVLELRAGELVETPVADTTDVLATISSMPEPDTSSGSYPPIDMSLYAGGASEHHVAFDTGPLAEPLELVGVPEVRLQVRASGTPHGITASLVVRGNGDYTNLDDALYGTDVELGVGACWGGQSRSDDGCYPGEGLARTATDVDVLSVGSHGIGRGSWLETYADPGEQWVEITVPLSRMQASVPAGALVSLVLHVDDPVLRGSGEGSTVEIRQGSLTLPTN